jgi:micrococcal nuclease
MPKKKTILLIISLFLVLLIEASSDNNEDLVLQDTVSTTTLETTTTTLETTATSVINQEIDEESGVLVIRVIDGDTIEIEGGQKVRYIGIDTPETVDPRKPVQCFGIEASNKNKELVEGKKVVLEKDVSETDKYGRLLRYIYVDGLFVNDHLVREGYAYAYTYPPNVKYTDQFLEAQKEAKENNRGL